MLNELSAERTCSLSTRKGVIDSTAFGTADKILAWFDFQLCPPNCGEWMSEEEQTKALESTAEGH